MKKRIIACALCALCLFGCAKNKQDKINKDSQTQQKTEITNSDLALERAVKLCEALKDAKYEEVYQCFGKKLKDNTKAKDLQTIMTILPEGIGDYVEISKDSAVEDDKGNFVATATLVYEQNGITFKYTFSKDGTVEGFFCNYSGRTSNNELSHSHSYQQSKLVLGQNKLEGVLTLPTGKKKPDCVIFVQDAGANDMDATAGQAKNKPLRDIAHTLAENGIASIRLNNRLFQHPELSSDSTTVYDEVLEDINAAIGFAVNTNYVNADRIFVLGHSVGAMLAPKIAQDNRIAGLILMAGSPRSFGDIVYDRNIAALENNTAMTDKDKQSTVLLLEHQRDAANNATADGTQMPFGISDAYLHSLNEATSKDILKNTEISMLILQGSEDFEVSASKDFELYKEILKDKENVSYRLYEGLNHLFMNSNGKKDETEYDTAGKVDTTVLSDIVDFITNAKSAPKKENTTAPENQEEKVTVPDEKTELKDEQQNTEQQNGKQEMTQEEQTQPKENEQVQAEGNQQSSSGLNIGSSDEAGIIIDMSQVGQEFFD